MEKLLINDLKRHNRRIGLEIQTAVNRVLDRGWYILGPELEAFEADFAVWCGAAQGIGVANGTEALELALRAVGVGAGDQVATVANAGMYSTTAIRAVSAVPLYVDIEPERMTLCANSLAAALTSQTRAIIVTHLYGQLADVAAILNVANAKNIPLIEDCAQAHGANQGGRKAGTFGVIGCFSFYPTKNLGALGDGGALITSDAEIAARIRRLRQYGWSSKYLSEMPGGRNSRLDEIQAAVLGVKLRYLNKWNERRRQITRAYNDAFADLPLRLPPCTDESYVAHLYVVRTAQRNGLRESLAEKGIASEIHYPVPDHRQRSLAGYDFITSDLTITEECCESVLTLPCFPELTDEEIQRVIAAVRDGFEPKRG